MSAYRFITLTCDVCGEIYDPGFGTITKKVRNNAKQEGWKSTKHSEDFCPKCVLDGVL